MKKFRVLSDLHLDINEKYPITLDNKDIFTIICGDTSGYPDMTIKWIKENCPNGVGVSGNHLPYNNYNKTIQELRNELATAFPITNSFTYLDCETNVFCKEVDNILFIGTCMYTNMAIKHRIWNPEGDIELNKRCSGYNMNDYRWGIKDNTLDPVIKISPNDYFDWFKNAYQKIENVLNENENLTNPKDVVLITHHPLITDFFGHNGYVEDYCYSQRHFNDASYASDMKKWLIRHTSIKCYCCGHIHDVYTDYRFFDIIRNDKSRCLVINNARGYVHYGHDIYFNPNRFIDTETWQVIIET
jgi:hypothetical protein